MCGQRRDLHLSQTGHMVWGGAKVFLRGAQGRVCVQHGDSGGPFSMALAGDKQDVWRGWGVARSWLLLV